MRKNILVKAMVLILIAAFVFTGCETAADNSKPALSGDLMVMVKSAQWPEAPEKMDDNVKSSLTDFSMSLFKESANNKGSMLVSPASVYLALGMAVNGADGETKDDILKALEAKGISLEDLNKACRDYILILGQKGKKTELSIANSIWYRQGYNPDKDFLQKNADYFLAAAEALDFNKPEAVGTINGWVNKKTNKTIDKIIDKIDASVVMYLINAIYFKSEWQDTFEAKDTTEAEFDTGTEKVTAKFMHRTADMLYLDKDGLKGIMLPYDDGRFSFFALLPDEGTDISDFIQDLDGNKFNGYISSFAKTNLSLSLPKFETKYEDSLKNELDKLGMGVAFEPGAADFSLMSADRSKDLYISEIKHKTYCRVDELGTEAAAVTSIEMRLTAIMEPEIQIRFDRPFMYGITDSVTGVPLFIGVMADPAE